MKKGVGVKERRFIDRARVCRIGSVGADGRPHVAPLCHALVDATVFVATDRDGVTARNLRRKPRAEVLCDEYFENWNRLRGVLAHGKAHRVEAGSELKRAQQALTKKFKQYAGEELDYVIALRLEAASSWGL
jgi:nitroimidazol reductase NimA-like FMN-containing flavoprotein (pyridoxamine 5'-phosphate oxidase superfamily)